MRLQRLTLFCLFLLLPTLTHAKIVFKSGSDIYVMDDDGRNAKMLVKRVDGRSVLWPVWSPDGKQIAFLRRRPIVKVVLNNGIVRNQTPTYAIFIINSDGTGEFLVTDGDDNEHIASWSPDGKYLVFTSDRLIEPGKGTHDAWTIHIATKALRRLTRTVSLTTAVAWSPDGKYIAYRDKTGVATTIHLMRADGSGQRELVKSVVGHYRTFPRWSVDSQSVVYNEWNGHSEKIVIHNIKTNKRQVVDTPDNWDVHGACFMGSKYLLISAEGLNGTPDKHEIYRYHLVTGEIVKLTNTPAINDYMMDWIDDDVLSVSPKDKKKVTWGTLKQ